MNRCFLQSSLSLRSTESHTLSATLYYPHPHIALHQILPLLRCLHFAAFHFSHLGHSCVYGIYTIQHIHMRVESLKYPFDPGLVIFLLCMVCACVCISLLISCVSQLDNDSDDDLVFLLLLVLCHKLFVFC